MAGLQVELFSSVYIDEETITLLRFQYEISGRLFVFYNNWADDLTELISFPSHAVRSLSVYSLVYSPVLLLSSLMVSSHCRRFIQFSSFFCGMSHVYEQLHKTVPLQSGGSQCKKAWHFSIDIFLCCVWTNMRYWRNSA